MRPRSALVSLVVCFCSVGILFSQTTSQVSPSTANSAQALAALQNAIASLAGKASVSDVTLTGIAEWIAGSDNETGTVTYKALSSANRLDMTLTGGARSEIRNSSSSGPAGTWIGPDGVSHAMAYHNLMTDPGWFPLFALANVNSSTSSLVTYIGPETHNGVSVVHLSACQQPPDSTDPDASLLQHVSQLDIYLDPASLLPISLTFNMHPDNNMLVDVPTEIRYSNYQNFGGTQIPLHVQKFVNNSLAIDLQFQNAVLNSGLSVNSFAIQ